MSQLKTLLTVRVFPWGKSLAAFSVALTIPERTGLILYAGSARASQCCSRWLDRTLRRIWLRVPLAGTIRTPAVIHVDNQLGYGLRQMFPACLCKMRELDQAA